MAKSAINPKTNWFFDKPTKWQEAYSKLRNILLDCGLQEEVKWGNPCYTLPEAASKKSGNVVLIHGFKEYCALLFFKGALLKDKQKLLIQQTEHVQAARQMRFTKVTEIVKLKNTIKSYVKEAMALEKSGAKVELKKTSEFKMPEEFREKLDELPELKTAFKALTPGRQRGYLLYFSSAKQAKTRMSRIEKYKHQILNGKGLED